MVQLSLLIIAVFSLLVGIFVLMSNPKLPLFRLYFFLSLSSATWITVNAIVVNEPISVNARLLLRVAQLITPLALSTSVALYLFLKYFSQKRLSHTDLLVISPSLVVSLFSFTSMNAYLNDNGEIAVGSLYPFYLAALLTLLFFAFRSLRTSKNMSGTSRLQLRYLRYGVASTVVPAVIFGSLIPAFSESNLSDISPLFTIFFLSFAGIAIVKHRLFDVRLLVVRSLGYVLAISMLVGIFTGVSLLFSTLLEDKYGGTFVRVVNALLLTLAALLFRPTKVFFDKITNNLFYRDAYDSQVFLDDLNRVLVQSVDIKPLLVEVSKVIERNIKSNYCVFGIRKTSYFPRRIVGTFNKTIDETDISAVREDVKHIKQRVILTDALGDEYAGLRKRLLRHDAAVVVRLVSTMDYDVEGLGYLVLGAKKSGNLYSKQDKKVIEIVANELVIAIQNALRFEEIEEFNVTLQQKIDEATSQLKRTNKKLKSLDETKDEFISMASHQLRTPLTSVKGYLSMVLEKDAGELNAMQEQLLNQAFVSSQRMVYLIADLLNVSRLKTGKFNLDLHPTNLADVVEGEISQLIETAKSKNMTLTYNKPTDFPLLNLDETKIRQVIMNFADNAIYYTPNGGKIDIELKDKGETIEFKVVDNGLGVPKQDQPHLFGKFYRAGNARKARPDGTGLGLFMAKKVIAVSGGAIVFKSEENKGSTFGFTFAKRKLMQSGLVEHSEVDHDL